MEKTTIIRALRDGANQRGVRDHNERLILSLLQRHGALAAMDIARQTHLSAQTISVILRKLSEDGLISRGEPIKGKVGKPSIPVKLNTEAVFSIGFKIGRRSSEAFLTNLAGDVLKRLSVTYDVAEPSEVFAFMAESAAVFVAKLGAKRAIKLCGIGIAMPTELWKWRAPMTGVPTKDEAWRGVDIKKACAKFTDLPIFMINDATGACWAEHVYGRGKEFGDYAYFFVASMVGGGIVVDQSVYKGTRENAGALGSIPVAAADGTPKQLIDVASLFLLEKTLTTAGLDPRSLWVEPQDWSALEPHVDRWLQTAAHGIAQACITCCAVIDFEAIIIDGAFPHDIRTRLVERVRDYMLQSECRGIIQPRIEEGRIGAQARAIGAACEPIYAQYFLGAKAL